MERKKTERGIEKKNEKNDTRKNIQIKSVKIKKKMELINTPNSLMIKSLYKIFSLIQNR